MRLKGAVNLTKWTHFSPGAIEHRPAVQDAHVTCASSLLIRRRFDGAIVAEQVRTWSRHSRRRPPRNRPQIAFRFGDFGGIVTTSMSALAATAEKWVPNSSSLSRIKNRGTAPYGVASRSCWATHASLGKRVTLACATSRLPWLTITNAKIGRNQHTAASSGCRAFLAARVSGAHQRKRSPRVCRE